MASWVRDRFVEGGLDEVQLVPYKVLLSYPDMSNPNQVSLLDSNGKVNFTTSGRQTPLFSSEEFSPLVQPNFNAYSANGTVEVKLNFYLYCFIDDIKINYTISLRGNSFTQIMVGKKILST